MISEKIIKKAIDTGIVTFIDSPMNDGVVAKIKSEDEESWFYIPGRDMIDNNADWYTENISLAEKAHNVYTALTDLEIENTETYNYYKDMILSELNRQAKKFAVNELLLESVADALCTMKSKYKDGDIMTGAYELASMLTGKTETELTQLSGDLGR